MVTQWTIAGWDEGERCAAEATLHTLSSFKSRCMWLTSQGEEMVYVTQLCTGTFGFML